MMKQAWRSYLASLHPRNIKKVKSATPALLTYWGIIYPMMMLTIHDQSGKTTLYMIIKMLPFFIMAWSNISSRYFMTKQMFLSPMKLEERKKYVNYVLYIKIGIPVLIGFFLELIFSGWIGFNWLRIVVMLFIYVSVGIAIYIYIDGTGWADRRTIMGTKGRDGRFKWAWMNVISFVYGVLIMCGVEFTDFTNEMDLGSRIFIGIGLFLIAILNVLIIRNQYKDVIEQASNYEETFRVLGKVTEVKYDLFAK